MTEPKPHWSEPFIARYQPCSDAADWMRGQKSAAVAWRKCKRADWMLWTMARLCDSMAKRKRVVLIACACAETALKYVPKGETRPAEAIRVARAWTRGRATIEQVRVAANAADAATSSAVSAAAAADADAYAADAAAAAANAAYAAAYAADADAATSSAVSAAAADDAADADASAAAAAADAAADADAYAADAAYAARIKARRKCADIVRRYQSTAPKMTGVK